MGRNRGILSQLNSAIGSITHWKFRALILFICKKLGIRIHPKIQFWVAYFLTGSFLILIGVWSYFRLFHL